ncbi:Gfo/Idh/MocA family protein [Engelhardtia mirabilis]|uniref:Glucose--fructose oxidoreductase n=1 Tax=Engelhardtia mirabilis TaxID=2528011 RepID=A0A518BG51_9BACT|nr:Glucose--fructose oxidoreductase precursor [Planctomycetes bacterium Pla133]QDV00290.1 Glucose--fructose oxidoreductase precursor [Planctomycetes bacterium Pla86]
MSQKIRVAMLGQQFMGRAHSNAFRQVGPFCSPPLLPELHTVAGRDGASLTEFAARFGWANTTTDWRTAVVDPEVDLVDVATPNFLHREPSVAALEAGKHVLCEKPLAGSFEDARAMRDAAAAAAGRTFVWFNYRRCPAVATAWKLAREGRLGRIYHVRATYLQNWGGPQTPMSWRFDRELAGSGAHGDLNAHLIDLARFLVGEPITEIHGATSRRWVESRLDGATGERRPTSVDDALLFTAGFAGGAVGSFEASRLANPHQNANSIELNGELGSVRFDFEDMNLLHFCDASDGAREGGWRRIMCTHAGEHPYVEHWWPDAHLIGYEHTFTNMVSDVLRSLVGEEPVVPLCDFADAFETQRVLEAALRAVDERRAVMLDEVS